LLETTYSNWKSLGLENDSNIPEISNKEHSMNLQSDILATSDYLESAKTRDDVILIGLPNAKLYVRSFKEWKNLQKPTVMQEDAHYWDLSAE